MANQGERVASPPSGKSREAGTGRRGLVWVGAGVLLLAMSWTLAGFTLIPWIAKRELPRIIAEQTQHRARIGEVRFNPFTLTLEATGFAVEDPAGQPLLGFKSASIDLQWSSLARRGWVLSGVRLGEPFVNLVVDKDGGLNLAKLAAPQKPQSDAAPAKASTASTAAPATLPRFDIGRIDIASGRIGFEDRRGGYRNALADLSLTLKNLTTLDSEPGDYALSARTTGGAKLRWNGTLSLAPLVAAGTLSVSDAALPEFNTYLASLSQIAVASGKGDLELPYRLELPGGAPRLAVVGAKLGVRGLALQTAAGAPLATLAEIDVQGVNVDLLWSGAEPRFTLSGARLGLHELTLKAMDGAQQAKLAEIAIEGLDFDLHDRRLGVKSLLLADGQLALARDANGEIDLQKWLAAIAASKKDASAPRAAAATKANDSGAAPWQLAVAAIEVRNVAARYSDAGSATPLLVTLDGFGARASLGAQAGDGGQGVKFRVAGGAAQVQRIGIGAVDATKGAAKAAGATMGAENIAAGGITFDSAASALGIDTIRVGSLKVDASLRDGRLNLLDLIPASKPDPSSRPLALSIAAIELAEGSASLADSDQKLDVALDKITVKAGGVAPDRNKPLGFELAAQVRSGGRIAARGSLVPATGRLDTVLQVSALALAPLQPLLSRYAAVRLTSGEIALDGTLKGNLGNDKAGNDKPGNAKSASGAETGLAYAGSAALSKVAIDDLQGTRLAGWQSLSAASLRFGLVPARLDIDELRWVAPAGRFALEKDGSSNFSRLKVGAATGGGAGTTAVAPTATPTVTTMATSAPPPATSSAAAGEAEPMALAVRRVVVTQGKLEFSDASIEPGFTAMITDLAGTANGLSSARDTRSQFSLEGRVGEFGFARLSGAVNVYAPRDRTTFRVELRNIDLPTVSPYSMRFAGYRIAEGRATLDLNYRVRGAQIEGDNRIVLDRLVLGERVDSPQALNIPLALAIALLKEPDGSIKIDLPITGSLDDPQFSLAPLIWKAVGNFLGGIISAPFRMLGRLFGGADDEGAGTILFEPAASRLLPPEREKLIRLAGLLEKRPELRLTLPAYFDQTADSRALRRAALARDISRRAGFEVADDEGAGQVNADDRRTRAALRSLFSERFSAAELARVVAEAEAKERAGAKPAVAGTRPEDGAAKPADGAAKPLSLLDRARNLVAGEPQLADARPFYNELARRLRDSQPFAADALPNFGKARAAAIEAGLRGANVAAERIIMTPPAAAPPAAAAAASAPAAAARSGDADARYVKLEMSLSSR